VENRTGYLTSIGAAYQRVETTGDGPLPEASTAEPTHILVEYTSAARLIRDVRRRFPKAFLAVRAVNIEPLQLLHAQGTRRVRSAPRLVYRMARLLLADILSKRTADVVYSINDWESRMYWSRLPGKARVSFLPYYAPSRFVGRRVEKEKLVLCLAGGAGIKRHDDLIERFIAFARIARDHDETWRFAVTGDLEKYPGTIPPWISQPGHVNDIAKWLAAARAVAVLSPLGFGFKTTIVDALANGCWPIVHPRLLRRSPTVIRPHCLGSEGRRSSEVVAALQAVLEPPPGADINRELRVMATRVLARDFG
jgi:hypothetical protein